MSPYFVLLLPNIGFHFEKCRKFCFALHNPDWNMEIPDNFTRMGKKNVRIKILSNMILYITGVDMSDIPDEPVFATQLNEQDYPDFKSGGAKSKGLFVTKPIL